MRRLNIKRTASIWRRFFTRINQCLERKTYASANMMLPAFTPTGRIFPTIGLLPMHE